MDSSNCSLLFLWIPWIVFLHLCPSATGRRCPQGLIEHDNVPRVGEFSCCQPTRCGVGKEVVKCTVNGTQDQCQSCSGRYNQSLRTSSYTLERCSQWPLDENCRHNQGHDKVTFEVKRCMCDIELGYKYDRPDLVYEGLPTTAFCQPMKAKCDPGYEPNVDGTCQPCNKYYFKTTKSFHLCEPKTNCSMLGLNVVVSHDETKDDECSKPDPVTIPPAIPEQSSSPSTTHKPPTPQLETSTPVLTTSTSHDTAYAPSQASESAGSENIVGPIIGSVVFVLVVLIIIFAVFLCKRRRRRVFCCGECAEKCAEPGMDLHSMPHRDPCNKIGNGSIPHHLYGGDKTNNNHPIFLPSLQSQPHMETYVTQMPDQYSNYTPAAVAPEPKKGILRNVVAVQRSNHPPESFDSIGQEKAHLPMEANSDVGENDPLLVTHSHGAGAYQNPMSSPYNISPPVHHPYNSPVYSYAKKPGLHHHQLIQNGHTTPATNVPTPAFTRSTSVIASPEGEVDEDSIDARVPRFSQLLPDGDQSVTGAPSPPNPIQIERDQNRNGSAGPVTTQLRAPFQRVNQPITTTNVATQQLQKRANPKPGLPAVPVTNAHENVPDHRIMNLKEQQLAESLHSEESSSISLLNEAELPGVRTLRQPSETQQTQVKTETPALEHETYNINPKTDPLFPKTVLPDYAPSPNVNVSSVERHPYTCDNGINTVDKRLVNESNSSDRRYVPTGGGGNSTWVPPAGADQHKSCIKTTEDARKQRYNRTVSFEEDENAQTNLKHRGNPTSPDIQQRQHHTNVVSDVDGSNDPGVRHPLRALSDPEYKGSDVDDEETERKCVSLEYTNSSAGSSKTSVNSEQGGPDSNSGSPSRAALYRRSQSDNTHSSTESTHKPPPRSMSEEKPQKADRPIAKVKPMPASDSTINQLVTDETEGSDLQGQIPATALDANSSTSPSNILSYSSEDTESQDSSSEEQGV
uniref:TNFR-Cys domain-containing protein n=1 Tax=Biomphalaria glabrata TaxID=6526 RepID=A0A2C9LHK3_BIOGL